MQIIDVPLDNLKPNPFQPETRLKVDEATAEKFGLSIQAHGLLQMPVVRLFNVDDQTYEVGDGWRRLAGFKWLAAHGYKGYATMPVDVRDFTDQEMADLIIEANTTRDDLSPIDLAWFYTKYLDKFPSVTQAELAHRHNKSQPEIANTMRLLDLPEDVQRKIISRKITGTHGLRLLQLGDKVLMSRLAEEAIDQDLSVSALDTRVKQVIAQQRPRMVEPEPRKKVVRVCRVCGCDEEHPCVDPKTGEACHWVEENLCSLCQPVKKEPPEAALKPEGEPLSPAPALSSLEQPEVKAEEEAIEEEHELAKARQEEDKEAEAEIKKPAPKAEARPAPVPAPAKPTWKRKLVLEEVGEAVKVSLMSEKGFIMKGIAGTLEAALEQLPDILAEANEKWTKEEK